MVALRAATHALVRHDLHDVNYLTLFFRVRKWHIIRAFSIVNGPFTLAAFLRRFLINLISVRPSFITKPQNQTVIEKEKVTFYCNASGNPIPSITWVKDGKTVSTGNTLRFETTWRHHSGRYWCWSQNGLNVTIKASADLNVQCKYQHMRNPHTFQFK